MTNKNSLLLCK